MAVMLAGATRKSAAADIQPVVSSSLSDVAAFLSDRAGREAGASGTSPAERARLEQSLRWLLLERPGTITDSHGLCVRGADGALGGLLLWFPGEFLADDRRLRGVGSGGFFVDPSASMLGYIMFKRHLKSLDGAFFFATTCNASSAALWTAAGGSVIPNSDVEYILPLRLAALLPALVGERTSSRGAHHAARVLGRGIDPWLRLLVPKRSDLAVAPCRDWDKLAALFRRHRPPQWITTDRSAAFLQWRYGPGSPNHPYDICVFRDRRGHEGWFALGTIVRGRQRQLRGCVLLDAVWPRDTLSFRDLLPAIVGVATARADALYVHARPGVDYGECRPWLVPWRLKAPRGCALPSRGETLAVSALDLVAADGDAAV